MSRSSSPYRTAKLAARIADSRHCVCRIYKLYKQNLNYACLHIIPSCCKLFSNNVQRWIIWMQHRYQVKWTASKKSCRSAYMISIFLLKRVHLSYPIAYSWNLEVAKCSRIVAWIFCVASFFCLHSPGKRLPGTRNRKQRRAIAKLAGYKLDICQHRNNWNVGQCPTWWPPCRI